MSESTELLREAREAAAKYLRQLAPHVAEREAAQIIQRLLDVTKHWQEQDAHLASQPEAAQEGWNDYSNSCPSYEIVTPAGLSRKYDVILPFDTLKWRMIPCRFRIDPAAMQPKGGA